MGSSEHKDKEIDQEKLLEICLDEDEDYNVREEALRQIIDPELLLTAALEGEFPGGEDDICLWVIDKIRSEESWREIASHAFSEEFRTAAIYNLTSIQALSEVLENNSGLPTEELPLKRMEQVIIDSVNEGPDALRAVMEGVDASQEPVRQVLENALTHFSVEGDKDKMESLSAWIELGPNSIVGIVLSENDGTDLLIRCIEKGADVNLGGLSSPGTGFYQDNSLIHYTANQNQFCKTKILLEYGADANVKACENTTALHFAVNSNAYDDKNSEDRIRMIELLLTHDADVNAQRYYGLTPLHDALYLRRPVAIIKKLVDHGADVNMEFEDENSRGHTALNICDTYGLVDHAKIMEANGGIRGIDIVL